ncbi:hypothetical protein GGR56DRAFT_660618 [Xylariaceae sp. FL0804]|nr:hypothetical protein GGR56DRAFT_660618 [Xylariaceae sp. FL0804]
MSRATRGGPSASILNSRPSPTKKADIVEHKGEFVGGPHFDLFEPDGRTTRQVNVPNWPCPTSNERAYLPIHSACLEMAKRMFPSSPAAHVKDMRALFLALRWRHAVSRVYGVNWCRFGEANYTVGPVSWYLPERCFWSCNDHDEAAGQDSEFNVTFTFTSDPIDIPDLTDTLLRNLKPCQIDVCGDKEAHPFWERITALPEDIFHIILSYLRSCRDFPPVANFMLPQHFWKTQLTSPSDGLLPWLWDIDPVKVESKAIEPYPGGPNFEWNWELLVRQLSRGVDAGIRQDIPENIMFNSPWEFRDPDSWDGPLWTWSGYHSHLEHVPRGLQNRRRIWQLLEEMFVGDQLPIAEPNVPPRERCVELPFTKGGRLRQLAIWIPCIATEGFARRIGGQVYRMGGKGSLQYWQTRAHRAANGDEDWEDWREEHVEPASIDEIYAVLRQLEYPV